MNTIQCVDCLDEFSPTGDDIRGAREYERRAVAEQGVKPSSDDMDLMQRFGPEICPACMPEHLRRRQA